MAALFVFAGHAPMHRIAEDNVGKAPSRTGDGWVDLQIKVSRSHVGAVLAQCTLIGGRLKLRQNLSKLLPDKIHHKTCSWRKVPSRWINQVDWNAGGGKVAQHANQSAATEIIENFEQTEMGESISGPCDQVCRTSIVGEKSAGHAESLAALPRDKSPYVRIRSGVMHDTDMVCEFGRSGWFAVQFDVGWRRHDNARRGPASAHHQ